MNDGLGAVDRQAIDATSLTICVAIATRGRAKIVGDAVRALRQQSMPPFRIRISAASAQDVAGMEDAPDLIIQKAHPGSCAQRNAIILAEQEADILLFMDDDFIPDRTYLETTEQIFRTNPELVVLTGEVLADGAKGPGLTLPQAQAILEEAGSFSERPLLPAYNGYGCNMSVRRQVLAASGILFDERLPLYGWLEDVDFSRRLSAYGSVMKSSGPRGVHLGTKVGRQPGIRFGYSQVANPIYLARKGTISWHFAITQLAKNVVANLVRSFHPEPYIDRRGRLKGHLVAIADTITGSLHPTRIRDI